MPRKACIDAPGALHHIIIHSIERKAIFKGSADRKNLPRASTESFRKPRPAAMAGC